MMVDKETRLDKGIYRTAYGYRVVLRVNQSLFRKRFPPTYTVERLRQWRDDHEKLHRRNKPRRGTFTADVDDYLRAVQAMPTYKDRKWEISVWLPRFGQRPRWTIKADEIQAQLHAWRKAGLAASTVNHRRTALAHLYRVLDGRAAFNPVRDVPRFQEPPPERRGVDLRTALKAIRRVKGPMTRARLLVLLWTGIRPSELMRVTPADVELEPVAQDHLPRAARVNMARCFVKTGKKGTPRIIPLNKSAVKALKLFARRNAWGPFSVQSARKSLVLACKKAPAIPQLRIYDLRHSYATALRETGTDLADIQVMLGHTSPRMTKRYAPDVPEKLRAAASRVRGKGSR